ncbi:hypothetical protein AMTRI_Chr06g194200 [Amborella trichopoda]
MMEAIGLARLQEDKIMAQRRQSKGIPPKISGVPVVEYCSTNQRRERGLCYNCNEKYSPQRRKNQKLYLLDGDTIDENQVEEEGGDPPGHAEDNPEIVMHALAGINSPQTMRVQGYIKKQSDTKLIDSSGTRNFITKQVDLYVYPCENFEVMIANGEKLACKG